MRIDWDRYPDDVEPVVAIMLARRHPGARRIRPSRGDRGIDVLVPSGPDGEVDVYQVKRFAKNLNASQKAQIQASLERIGETATNRGVQVANWYLTLPLDPTPENLDWLGVIAGTYPFNCDWRGLSFIDGLASEFPDVIDYYLRDGSERLSHAVKDLAQLLRARQPDGQDRALQPNDFAEDLGAVYRAINRHDPHYRYSFRVDEVPPEFTDEPNLAFAQQTIYPDLCITHYVYERYFGAIEDNPIEIRLQFDAQPGDDLEAQLREHMLYGTAVSGPARFRAELPGGLGHPDEVLGSVWLGPSDRAYGETYSFRIQVIDPQDTPLSTVTLDMDPVMRGPSGRGVLAQGRERNGTFRIEIRTDLETMTPTFSLTALDVTGLPPARLVQGMEFLRVLRAPNSFNIGAQFGPINPDRIVIPDGPGIDVGSEVDIAADLAMIQEHTTVQIRFPDLAGVTRRDAARWRRAARLLTGETVTLTWNRWQFMIPTDKLDEFPNEDPGVEVAFIESFGVDVSGDRIELGHTLVHMLSAHASSEEPPMTEGDASLLTIVPGSLSAQAEILLLSPQAFAEAEARGQVGRVLTKRIGGA